MLFYGFLGRLLLYLLLTVLLEGAVMLLLFRRWDYVYYSLLCNLLTNPALNFILTLTLSLLTFYGRIGSEQYGVAYYLILLPLELAAVFVEGKVYAKLCDFSLKKALGLSFLLNALSCGAGFLYNFLRFFFLTH